MNKIINQTIKTQPRIKRVTGVVESINSNNTIAEVSVDVSDKNLFMLNKTRNTLSVGDSVWIHYWHNIADGYIAIKNALTTNSIMSGSYGLDVIGKEQYIEKSYLLKEQALEYETIHNYTIESEDDDYDAIDTSLNSVSVGEYFSNIDAGSQRDDYCLHTTEFVLSDGVSVISNWIPHFLNNQLVINGASVDGSFNVYQDLVFTRFTEIFNATKGYNELFPESRRCTIQSGFDTNTQSYAAYLSLSASSREEAREIIIEHTGGTAPTLSDYGFVVFLDTTSTYTFDNYAPICYRPDCDYLIINTIIIAVKRTSTGWQLRHPQGSASFRNRMPSNLITKTMPICTTMLTETKERRVMQ